MLVKLSETGFDYCAFLDYDSSNDFFLYELGSYKCPPGYGYGPTIRTRDIFHYVISGYGNVYINDKIFRVGPGMGFLIPRNIKAYYKADMNNPWSYVWLHIGGPSLQEILTEAGLTADNPVFVSSDKSDFFISSFQDIVDHKDRELYCIGTLNRIFDYLVNNSIYRLVKSHDPQLDYTRKIIRYIRLNYANPLHVKDIAEICGLERSYISRLFKHATGETIHNYLITYRLKTAAKMITETDFSIQYISLAVGYSDIFIFSKAFKKAYGMAPSMYREKNNVNTTAL